MPFDPVHGDKGVATCVHTQSHAIPPCSQILSLSLHALCAGVCFMCMSQVRVGSMCDPQELPGLAHFCEHMLFYSSERYPVEDEYSK